MLFSNVSLEVVDSLIPVSNTELNEERVVNINPYVLKPTHISVADKEIPSIITNKYHKDLSIRKTGNNCSEIIINEDNKALYLILDTFGYKAFKSTGHLILNKDDKNIELVDSYIFEDLNKTTMWGFFIAKIINPKKFALIGIHDTRGVTKYLTVHKGYVKIHSKNKINKFLTYIGERNIKIK